VLNLSVFPSSLPIAEWNGMGKRESNLLAIACIVEEENR